MEIDNFADETHPVPSVKKLHDLVLRELKQVQKIKFPEQFEMSETQDEPESSMTMPKHDEDDVENRMEHLKKRAQFLENEILKTCHEFQDVHEDELSIVKEELKQRNVDCQHEIEAHFRKQKCRMDNVVNRYTVEMLEKDESAENLEKILTCMLDDLATEAVIGGWEDKKKAKLKVFRNVLKRIVKVFK